MRFLMVAVLVTAFLAGCSDDPAPVEDDDFGQDLEATDSTGVIRGVVVSPSIVPISDVTVRVLNTDLSQKTGENGEFGFSGLEEKTYFVQVSRIGWVSSQSSVEVKAGVDRPPIMKILMDPDESSRPFAETLTFAGFLQCGTGHEGVGSTNPCAFGDSDNVRDHAVSRPVTHVQSELVWDGTSLLGDSLSLSYHDPYGLTGTESFARSTGASPVILSLSQQEVEAALGDDYEQLTVKVFPGADQPLTVILEQQFQVFTTFFYGMSPDEDWTFIEDGPHPVE